MFNANAMGYLISHIVVAPAAPQATLPWSRVLGARIVSVAGESRHSPILGPKVPKTQLPGKLRLKPSGACDFRPTSRARGGSLRARLNDFALHLALASACSWDGGSRAIFQSYLV